MRSLRRRSGQAAVAALAVSVRYSLAFVPRSPAACRSSLLPVSSSFYDTYDCDAARNLENDRPDWAGGGLASNMVNWLINTKPLYELMKVCARQVLINNAETKGIEWRRVANELLESDDLKRIFDEKFAASHAAMEYPAYYTQPFHAYENGNLNWLAAAEVESATSSMCLRVWPKDKEITPGEAQDRLRNSILNALDQYYADSQLGAPSRVLDVACSAGVSTRYARRHFKAAEEVVGLDLSPFFLAVAELRERQHPEGIRYVHAKAEATGLPDNSFDLCMVTFMVHELPSDITRAVLKEMYRVVAPGGVVCITDNDPRSPVIQGLPKPLAVLMKSTEPFSDEYYSLNIEETLEQQTGFINVRTRATDPRHRTIMAYKPKTV